MNPSYEHADLWGSNSLLEFYLSNRNSTSKMYPSEQIFLPQILREGASYLDVGCALGGFVNVLAENLSNFSYTGIDTSYNMINSAKAIHPNVDFIWTPNGISDHLVSPGYKYDYVILLGINHLHDSWRRTLSTSYGLARFKLLFDLRETRGPTIEDAKKFSFNTNFADESEMGHQLPYNLINACEILSVIDSITSNKDLIEQFGSRGLPRATCSPSGGNPNFVTFKCFLITKPLS